MAPRNEDINDDIDALIREITIVEKAKDWAAA